MNSSRCASTFPSGTAIKVNAEGKEDKFVTNILPLGVYVSRNSHDDIHPLVERGIQTMSRNSV